MSSSQLKTFLPLFFIFLLLLVIQLSFEDSLKKPSHITKLQGTFIQPWLYMTYTDSQWDAEMKTLKEIGIEYLVMGDVANHNPDNTWTVYYPSKISYLKNYVVYDALEPLFKYCEKYDIKLYLGMGLDTIWDSDIVKEAGREANRKYMTQCNEITNELFSLYKNRFPETYFGFYFVTELFNTVYMETDEGLNAYADGLDEMFTMVIDNLNKLDSSMPLMFSPYVNIFGYGFTSISIDRFTEYWTEVLTRIPFRDGDMICPQDGNGGGGNDIYHLKEWTQSYRNAVDRSNRKRGTKLLLGTNAEMFVSPEQEKMSNPHGISYVGIHHVQNFATRMEICNEIVDSLFCFAYPHHYSPFNDIPKYHQNFVKYLKTGMIEKNKPIPPTHIKIELVTAEGKLHPQLTFSGMTDDTSVAQTNIYKNGTLYDYVVPGVKVGGNTKSNTVINVWIDWGFELKNETCTYEFECVDVNGNVSPKSSLKLIYSELKEGNVLEKETGDPIKWEKTVYDYITYQVSIGGVRIKGKDNTATEINLPDTIEGEPVTVIDWYAFSKFFKLKTVSLPETVTHISRCAFAHCVSLVTINMPKNLYSIEQYAFFGCPLLKGLALPKNLNQIEERAFCGCKSINEVTLPKSLKTVGNYAFFDCSSLNKVIVENSETVFGNYSIGYEYDNGYQLKEGFVTEKK